MPKNAPVIDRPTRIGERPLSVAVPISIGVGVLLAFETLSEILAFRLGLNPSLGAHIGIFYPPWGFAYWVWLIYDPVGRFFRHHYTTYDPSVYHAFANFALDAGISAFVGMMFVLAVTLVSQRKSGDAGDLHDSGSRWATIDVAKADRLMDSKAGPIIGGFDSATGVRALRYQGELGISYVEPPGGGKSSFLKSNLLIPLQHLDAHKWDDIKRRLNPWGEEPVIIASDPKFELFRETSGYQNRVLKKRIHLLAPLGVGNNVDVPDEGLASYNPFWSIRLGTDRGFQDCYFRTLAIVDGEGEGLKTHWDRTALSWGAAVIEKLGYRALATGDYESFSLPGLLEYVSSFNTLEDLLAHMLTAPDDVASVFGWQELSGDGQLTATQVKPSIAQAVREMLNKDERERAGVYSTFITFLAPYRSEILNRYCKTSSFSWREMADDPEASSIVYLGMDPMDIPKLRPYLRMVVGDAVEELTSGGTKDVGGRSARGNLRPTIFAMDEAAAWRRLQEIEHGSGYFRGYGVYLWLIWQSVAQQKRYYGSDNLLDETMDVLIYGRPKTSDGALAIQKMLGERTELVHKRSVSGARFALMASQAQETLDVVTLPLLSEKEIMQIQRDRYIALFNGHNYFLRKWEYFKDKALSQRAKLPYVRNGVGKRNLDPLFVSSVENGLSPAALARWRTYRSFVEEYHKRNAGLRAEPVHVAATSAEAAVRAAVGDARA
jgi:type IV secretion system protein VirD4